MEIHSSSLAFVPNRYKTDNRNDQAQTPASRQHKQANIAVDGLSADVENNPLPEKNVPQLQKINDQLLKQINNSQNTRASRAITAYQQENSIALKSERQQLLSGIDLFV